MNSVAWGGWALTIPKKWKPLQIKGDAVRGQMGMGSPDRLMLSLRWVRSKGRKDIARSEYEKASHGLMRKNLEIDFEPMSDCFPHSAWAPSVSIKRGRLGVYLGYSEPARLFVEILFNVETSTNVENLGPKKILPSLCCTSMEEETHWNLFGVGFVTPPGFLVVGRKLDIGDMSLLLRRAGGERLLVRQVYPSGLALSRRPREKWLVYNAFKEHRRFRQREFEEIDVPINGREMRGIRRRGSKRFPFPLGILGPRQSEAIVIEDTELERLLIAEYDCPDSSSRNVALESIEKMNLQLRTTIDG